MSGWIMERRVGVDGLMINYYMDVSGSGSGSGLGLGLCLGLVQSIDRKLLFLWSVFESGLWLHNKKL